MRFALLLTLTSGVYGLFLSGCSPVAMGPTTFLTDPGKYDYHNCEQLAEQRKKAADRELELKLLMDKAEQAAGGAAISVIAYQSDYILARDSSKPRSPFAWWTYTKFFRAAIARSYLATASSCRPSAASGAAHCAPLPASPF